jgi:hypothetical protein
MEWDATDLSQEDLQRGLQPVEPNLGIPSSPPGGRNLLAVQLWMIEVSSADSAVYGEVLWHPTLGRTESIRGLENRHGADDVDRIRRGLVLLRETAIRGRKPGSDAFESTDSLINSIRTVIREMHREGQTPTVDRAAEVLGMDRSSLYRALQFTESVLECCASSVTKM